MSKASLLELCHGEKKYETFSISENNESFLSDSWRKRIKRYYFKNQTMAMCVYKTLYRIRFYLIRVVLVQQPPCEHRYSSLSNSTLRPDATIQHSTFKSQHCAPRLRVQIIFVSFGLFVFIIISCSNSSERPAANKIREIREIRVRIKKQSKIRVHIKYRVRSACKKNYSCHSDYSCS